MKKSMFTLLIASFLLQTNCLAWEWESYGPPGIKANKLCFFENYNITAIACLDTGMFIIDYSGISFEYYSYSGMKVVEAVFAGFGFDSDSLLIVMSDGSWSDGIYSFHDQQYPFVPLHYCYKPNFILKTYDKYFVGYENGLLVSEDGTVWNEVPFFSGIACIDMTTNLEDLVVATNSDLNNTYLSNDDLNDWTQLTGDHISELCDCNYYNNVYFSGIKEGITDNCGFYQLEVTQTSWENVFYSYHLNAVGISSDGNPFVGWLQGNAPHTGIAKCFPQLTYLNDGLPDLNIHAISAPFIFGGTVVYCCTDNGIYSRVLSLGEVENKSADDLSLFPNPACDHIYLSMNSIDCMSDNIEITILNNSGSKMLAVNHINMSPSTTELTWNKGNMPPGIYYLKVRTKNETITEKFIIF